MYYPSSENKGADQLRGYREADLRLCFRPCRLLVFPGGSYICIKVYHPSKQFFSHVTIEQQIPGYMQYCVEFPVELMSLS